MRVNKPHDFNGHEYSYIEKAMRLLAWQTPCLHSDILFKSPGMQPSAHLPLALLAPSAYVAHAAWREHSSTSLKVQGGGCGSLLLNTIFNKRTSGFYFESWALSHLYSH